MAVAREAPHPKTKFHGGDMVDKSKFHLGEHEIPKAWYNIQPDLPFPQSPPLHPQTLEPVTPDFLSVLFPMNLILQEVSQEPYIEIPEPVLDIYRLWRPTPLVRALQLEKDLDTPAHIYFKNESVSPVGSHKPNTAVAQAFYNKEAGTKSLTTETGAGQWGSALAMGCNFFKIDLEVYMVKVSYQQKPYRRIVMENFGAKVFASPTDRTEFGRSLLQKDPQNGGSLGIAISEAVEVAATSNGKKRYSLGSVLNHVLMHQTVIGEEALKQMEMAGEYPDVVIGCAGGGSNFAGLAFPFVRENIKNGKKTRIVAVEPLACPSMTKGKYAYDYGDTAKMAPVVKMYTLGHGFVPPGIHAGGLRYHGMSPLVSLLCANKMIEATAVHQLETFKAARTFLQAEGSTPAPETAHAVCIAIDEALKAKKEGKKKVILFNFSGHGMLDLAAYDSFNRGELEDYEYPADAVAEAEKDLPKVKEG
jgi:tryptophan synthase beta chain